MTAGINHQDVFMCPVALLPYNVTQVKPKYRNNLLTLNTPSSLSSNLTSSSLSSNLSQRKAGGAQGEMETIQLLKFQPMIDLEFSTPARCVRRAKVFRAKFFRANFFFKHAQLALQLLLLPAPLPHSAPGRLTWLQLLPPTLQPRPTTPHPSSSSTPFPSWRNRERVLVLGSSTSLP